MGHEAKKMGDWGDDLFEDDAQANLDKLSLNDPCVMRVQFNVKPALVENEEFRPTYSVFRAVDVEKPWITAVTEHDDGAFELEIPLLPVMPYDSHIVIEQFVRSWTAPAEDPTRVETINTAGSVLLNMRDLITQHEINGAPLILHPIFDGKNIEVALKGVVSAKLLSVSAVKFDEMTPNSWVPENYETITSRLLAWNEKRDSVIKQREYTFKDVAGLHAPFYLTHGVPNFPQSFAMVPAIPPTQNYWINAFDAAVMRCFPTHSFESSMEKFHSATPEEKFSTYAMTARIIVDCSIYTPDASPIPEGTSVQSRLSFKHVHGLSVQHSKVGSAFKRAIETFSRIKASATTKHVKWQSYENFSVIAHRIWHGVLSGDCEDTGLLAALMAYFLRSASGLPEQVQRASDELKSNHSLFLLMSVFGPNSTVEGGERPKGGHATGSTISHTTSFSTRLSHVNRGDISQLNNSMPLCDAVDPVHMLEGTAPLFPNVTDMRQMPKTAAAVQFFINHREQLSDFTIQRATPIDAKTPDKFYSGALECFSIHMARDNWSHPYFMILSPSGTIGSEYRDFVSKDASSTPRSFLYAMPELTAEDRALQHSLLKFSTPHPELDAPASKHWTRTPATNSALDRLQKTLRASNRTTENTAMVVLLLPHRTDMIRAIGCLEEVVLNDPNVVNLSYFNSSVTSGAEMYQINIEIKTH